MSLAPSSPRLPSPPPAAEIQIGPNSPSGGPAAMLATSEMEQSHLDANSRRRIHPGTKSCDMATGPPLVPLNELDSPFQLQEHLAALHYHHTGSGTQALTRTTALLLSQPPPGIDRTLWLYELCRFLIAQCNSLIVGFLFDHPPCSANTCPEMRASEWQFLCAVHEQPKSCCAIDYCCHTLDWAANVVSDQRIFPSRFVVASDAHGKYGGIKSLVNVFRRLHRIFAHAWFQHRAVFWTVEAQTGLYVFFKMVCDLYDLLPAENFKLPPEAEGLEAAPAVDPEVEKQPPTILKPPSRGGSGLSEDENIHASIGRTNTRRHIRSSPSTGSAVTTVLEADEEDADGVSRRLRNMHLTPPDTVQEEAEAADVPVIVEHGVVAGPPPPFLPLTAEEPPVQQAEAKTETEAAAGAEAKPEIESVAGAEAKPEIEAAVGAEAKDSEEPRADQTISEPGVVSDSPDGGEKEEKPAVEEPIVTTEGAKAEAVESRGDEQPDVTPETPEHITSSADAASAPSTKEPSAKEDDTAVAGEKPETQTESGPEAQEALEQ